MMMPHETQEMLTLLREINETLKSILAGQGIGRPLASDASARASDDDDSKSRRK